MDYGSLLQLAKKNSDQKKEVKRPALPNLPPVRSAEELRRQEIEKKRVLEANISRFLSNKKHEEDKKLKEANKKRGELLSIRNQDSKARKRVKIMNKSAKSADKSAIEDAVGPSDYYVIEEPLCFMSKESLAQEEKFLENLLKGPAEEKFSKGKANTNRDLSGTKARVQLALQLGDTFGKEKVRESKDKSNDKKKEVRHKDHYHSDDEVETKKEEKPRKRQPAPPPMNYHELLLLAEKLQKEPPREPTPEKETLARPMTTKQREIYLYEEASRKRKEAGWKEEARLEKLGKLPPKIHSDVSLGRIPKVSASAVKDGKSSFSIPRIPKLNCSGSTDDKKPISSSSSSNISRSSSQGRDKSLSSQHGSKPRDRTYSSKPTENRDKRQSIESQSNKQSSHQTKSSSTSSHMKNNVRATESTNKSGSKPCSNSSSSKASSLAANDSSRFSKESKSKPPVSNDRKPRPLSPADLKKRNLPPSDCKTNMSRADERMKPKQTSTVESRSKQLPNRGRPMSRENSHSESSIVAKPRPTSTPSKSIPAERKAQKFPTAENKSRQGPSSSASSHHRPTSSPDVKTRQVLASNAKLRQFSPSDVRSRQTSSSDKNPRQFPSRPSSEKSRQFPPSDVTSRQIPPGVKPRQVPSSESKSRQFPPADVKPRKFPPSDVKPRQFPPSDVKPRQFPPADVKSRQFPPNDVRKRPKPPPKRRIIESDEEYDSEDADFIEDDPEEGNEDYSKYIKEIFGYDRSRYRGLDEDDPCMESSFQQQLKEEFTSTKLGLLEDLEDIQKEKRLAMMKKKRKLK